MFLTSFDSFPVKKIQDGKYFVKFVENEEELDQVLKLRFEVFNLELGEGLKESYATGRDEDDFDKNCHHLMAVNQETGKVVGTYRMQTMETADQNSGFYSASEFDFAFFPESILKKSVELGRACVAKDDRSMTVLNLLLKGVALYLSSNDKQYIFGCTSITSQDLEEGKRAMQYLKKKGYLHQDIMLPAKPDFACYQGNLEDDPTVSVSLPPLFAIYMRLGTRIISAPAIDRYFKTIDFLMLFDVKALSQKITISFDFFQQMNTIRAIIRAILILFVLIGLCLLFALNKILPAGSSRNKRRAAIQKNGSRWLCRIVGLKIQSSGRLPKPPFILVSNHLSYLDIIVLGSRLECKFISKAEVRQWPLLGALCGLSDTIFINRKNRNEIPRVNRLIEDHYSAGEGIVFFPEGTSTKGADVKMFKSSLLEFAAREQCPVYYASLYYKTPSAFPPAHESVCWWGDMEFLPHFKKLLQISRIKAKIHFGKVPVSADSRDVLAKDLHKAVVENFIPTCV